MAELPSGEGTNNGITVSMVGATLGTTSKDVGRLCTNQNINKWSKHKPVKFAKLSGLTEEDFKAAKYGLIVPYVQQMEYSSYFTLSVIRNMMNNNQNWSYQPPTGGASSPYRLGDFRRYKHDAVPPIYSNYGKTWEDKPYKAEYYWRQVSTNNFQLCVNFFFGSAKDDGANEWNLKFDDFSFSVFNEQDSLVNLENAHLMIAVFDGHVDPFSETFNAAPIVWIVSNHPTTNVDNGLQFRLPATAFTTAGQLSNDNPIIGAKTLVFMLGVNMNYTTTSAVFRLYDNTSPWSYKAGENFPTHYPSYCVSLPFDKQHYPVIWLDAFYNDDVKPIFFNYNDYEDDDNIWFRAQASNNTVPYWASHHTNIAGSGSSRREVRGVGSKMWFDNQPDLNEIMVYGGNTSNTYNLGMFISVLLYNKGSVDFQLRKSGIICKSDRADVTSNPIGFVTQYGNTADPSGDFYTIPAKGSLRIYMNVFGVYLPTSSVKYNGRSIPPENTLTFTYTGSQNMTLGKIKFKGTTDTYYKLPTS